MAKPMTAPVANSVATGPRSSAMWRCQSESSWPEMLGAEFDPPSSWHAEAVLDAGFAEAGVAYRWGNSALVAALR